MMPGYVLGLEPQTRNIALFLLLVVVVQFGYPVTFLEGRGWLFAYQVAYTLMFVSGVLISRERPWQLWINGLSGVAFLACNVWYALEPGNAAATLAAYGALVPFHLLVIVTLVRFMALQTRVDAATFLAAVAIYLLLGAVFVPIYGAIELFAPGSFVDSGPAASELVWQQFIYYSYTVLNTVGFGDVVPVTLLARSLSTFEATLGVLYIAFVIARLVNLYDGRDA